MCEVLIKLNITVMVLWVVMSVVMSVVLSVVWQLVCVCCTAQCHVPEISHINPLMPNDPYSGRTALLNPKCCILYIYSTNTGTEDYKHGIYCPFLSLQNAVCFIILTYLVPVLFTVYIQGVLNIAFYVFIQQIYVLNILNIVYTHCFFLFKMQFVS